MERIAAAADEGDELVHSLLNSAEQQLDAIMPGYSLEKLMVKGAFNKVRRVIELRANRAAQVDRALSELYGRVEALERS